ADRRRAFLEQTARIAEDLQRIDPGAGERGLRRALRARPQTDQSLVALVRHRRGRAFARHEAGARDVLVPRVVAADDLDVRVRLAVRQRAFDLRAAAEELISVADPVSGYAELALTLVVPERRDLARL